MCRLLSKAQLAGSKHNALLSLEWLGEHNEGLFGLTACRRGTVPRLLLQGERDQARASLRTLRELFAPDHLYVELQIHLARGDQALAADLAEMAESEGLPIVATNDVHYAMRSGHRLQDVLVAIENNTTIYDAGDLLRPNSEYHLKGAAEMTALFADYPQALENTLAIAERCHVDLQFREKALPPQPEANEPLDVQLRKLCYQGVPDRYGQNRERAIRQLEHELDVINEIGLSGYFLLVKDIVRFANENGIQVRGRGSAANSIIAYLLGITNVDPLVHDLLFERFLSAEARIMPDIDLDFCSRRREEVIQYVYDRYGADHVAMVCNYVTFRPRSAVRDVGKALGLPLNILDVLAKTLRGIGRQHFEEAAKLLPEGINNAVWELFQMLCEEIQGLPRHLSIHVGGMCITQAPLVELVPLERATMPGRVVVQWDKDSVEDAGLIKMDILSLRTLSAIDECLGLIEEHNGVRIDLDKLPLDDPAVYNQLQCADTVGAFQVESRAQQQALVRMRPTCFADIVVQVAIIRPGPLQGNMVHPFFQRRMKLEPVQYPHPMLEPVLKETLGVIIFQEQVIRVAMVMGKFTPGEADLLRRAMSRHRSSEEMALFRDRFVAGALSQGVAVDLAETIFQQLLGICQLRLLQEPCRRLCQDGV